MARLGLAAERRASDPAAAPLLYSGRAAETQQLELPFWCPLGYAPVRLIPAFTADWLEQGHTFQNLPGQLSGRAYLNHIGRALAWGDLPAFGVPLLGGGLLKVSPDAWRSEVPDLYSRSRRLDQFTLAIEGQAILAEPYIGPPCRPVVSLANLADWLGASIETPPAAISPSGESVAVKPASEHPMHAWMLGYAQARKDLGQVIKRDEALRVLQQHFPPPNTTREHEAAYEALPFPELRLPPRRQKDT